MKEYKKRLKNREKMPTNTVLKDAQESSYSKVPYVLYEELSHKINKNLVQLEQGVDLFCFSIREIEDIINEQ